MLVVPTYLAHSKIHGIGLFAAEPINKWKFIYFENSLIDIEIDMENMEYKYKSALDFIKNYSYIDKYTDKRILNIDNARFMNHSRTPNTGWSTYSGWAIKDIAEDEEITCDYSEFNKEFNGEF